MNALIEAQILNDKNGKPTFAVIPFDVFQCLCKKNEITTKDKDVYLPDEVVEKLIMEKKTIIQAWREYRNLTQAEVAEKMGITQAAYSQMETAKKNRKATLQKIAEAMNIDYLQLLI